MASFKGYKFPFQASGTAVPAATVPPKLFADSIKQILLTEQGERVMRPDFGSRLRRKLFENINKDLVTVIQKEIVEVLTRWEPRVEVTKIEVFQNEEIPTLITVNVEYLALGQNVTTGPILIGQA